MNEAGAYIYGAAARVWPVEESPPDLKPEIQALWGKRFRRVNHFIELALIGAKSCLARSREALTRDCDIYLATEQGNVADVAKITETLFKRLESPMPLEFLNVPNNMAGFYLAQGLGVHSSNLTVAHRAFPFETALDIAMFNIAASRKTDPRALVGGVEECAYPLAQHRLRMGLAAHTPLAEGSSWLYIGGNARQAPARCEWVKFFPDRNCLLADLQSLSLPSSTYLAGGYGMDETSLNDLASAAGIDKRYDCRDVAPYHDTHCAYTVASFIVDHQGHLLVHVNRDARDRYAAVCISML
jgi:hypothetical protein